MTGPKSFEGGMEQSRPKQLDKKKELEKSSDKLKADKEAGKRLNELARPKMSLTDKLKGTDANKRQEATEEQKGLKDFRTSSLNQLEQKQDPVFQKFMQERREKDLPMLFESAEQFLGEYIKFLENYEAKEKDRNESQLEELNQFAEKLLYSNFPGKEEAKSDRQLQRPDINERRKTMNGSKPLEGGVEKSRQKQLEKKELEKKDELEKSSDKSKVDKEAGKRLDELARPKMSLTDKLREARKGGSAIGDSGKLPELSLEKEYQLQDFAKDTAITLFTETVKKLAPIGALHNIFSLSKGLVDTINESYDYKMNFATAQGLIWGVAEIGLDVDYPRNYHIQEGKSYTVDELHQRAWKQFSKSQGSTGMVALLSGAEPKKAFRTSIQKLVDASNHCLKEAKTPAERLSVLKEFEAAASKKISELNQ